MKILVATNHLLVTGGTENFTYALIGELVRKGHDVEYYCKRKLRGKIAEVIERDFGVKYKSKYRYDLVLANHKTMIKKLWMNGFIIQTCHGIFPKMEQPSKYADIYIAITEEVNKHLESKGHNSDIILNGIDCAKFYPKYPIYEKPKSILSLCQGKEANDIVKSACNELGIEFLHASKNSNNVIEIEKLINKADIVVGIGRSLYDAMSCGRACISFDSRSYSTKFNSLCSGGDGYITKENINVSIYHNCSGRGIGNSYDKNGIIGEIKKYRIEDGEYLRRYAIENLDINKNVDKYLKIYEQKVREYKLFSIKGVKKYFRYFKRNR